MRSIEERMIDYIDGTMESQEKQAFEEILKEQPSLMLELEEMSAMTETLEELPVHQPSLNLEQRFNEMIDKTINDEARIEPKVVSINKHPWKKLGIAASILVCGMLIGWFNNQDGNVSTVANVQVDQSQVKYVNDLMEASSPMKRIQGIYESSKLSDPDKSMIKLLGNTLKTDQSSNVRLAAAKALSDLIEHEEVRVCLVEALAIEPDASVKIEIINILSNTRDQRAVDPLNQVIDNEDDLKFVKDEAQKGLLLINNTY